MKRSNSARGILALVFGIAIFSVQDLILKLISGDYPLHQAMVLRSLTAIPFLLLLTLWMDGTLRTLLSPTWPAMLARGLLNFSALLPIISLLRPCRWQPRSRSTSPRR